MRRHFLPHHPIDLMQSLLAFIDFFPLSINELDVDGSKVRKTIHLLHRLIKLRIKLAESSHKTHILIAGLFADLAHRGFFKLFATLHSAHDKPMPRDRLPVETEKFVP